MTQKASLTLRFVRDASDKRGGVASAVAPTTLVVAANEPLMLGRRTELGITDALVSRRHVELLLTAHDEITATQVRLHFVLLRLRFVFVRVCCACVRAHKIERAIFQPLRCTAARLASVTHSTPPI